MESLIDYFVEEKILKRLLAHGVWMDGCIIMMLVVMKR